MRVPLWSESFHLLLLILSESGNWQSCVHYFKAENSHNTSPQRSNPADSRVRASCAFELDHAFLGLQNLTTDSHTLISLPVLLAITPPIAENGVTKKSSEKE